MTGLRRSRFALLLALGFALLPASSAWSYSEAVGEPVVPDGDAGYQYISGGGAPRPDGIVQAPGDGIPSERHLSRADRVGVTAPSFYELVRSVWLLTWKTGILP